MHDKEFPAFAFVWQEAQNGRPARPEGARPRSVLSVREDAERLRTPLAGFFSILLDEHRSFRACGHTFTLTSPAERLSTDTYRFAVCQYHS